jgi:acyl-coenzyme A synthetase/AMP-(fatty) acid ligase
MARRSIVYDSPYPAVDIPDVTFTELMAFVAERVAPHKRIRQLEFVEAIPKSTSGKILRRVLIEEARR